VDHDGRIGRKCDEWRASYDLELEHDVLAGVLELRLTQRRAHSGCPDSFWMAEYTITISDFDIASAFKVIHDYQGSTERIPLEGSL
jgi:hypothetical protein